MATGGLGYIGSETSLLLLQNGFDVLIVDSLINSSFSVFERIKKSLDNSNVGKKGKLFFRKGDIRNYDFVKSVFAEFKYAKNPIESVIHFAGIKSVPDSQKNSLNYWDVNVNGAINLLIVMKENNCNNIVFSSSATIYKSDSSKKIKESHKLHPINPYGNTKLAIEKILGDLFNSEKDKWRIASLRYFNPAGSNPNGFLRENISSNSTNLFPTIFNVLDNKKEFLEVFGNDWPTEDGTCVRDFIHVTDLARAHILSLKYLLNNDPQNIAINIGTGKGASVLEVINTFKEVLNLDIKYKFVKRRDGDYPYVVADNSLANSMLKWHPSKNLSDICKDSWKSHIQNL